MRNILFLLFVFAIVAIPGRSSIAQPQPQLPRVGVLLMGALGELSISDDRDRYAAFLSGLRELGYIQGRNIIVELRQPKGKPDRLPGLAAELVQLKVAAIVVSGSTAIEPAVKATKTIPIVMIGPGDAVGRGFIDGLSLPGGNVTGLAQTFNGLRGKQIEVLKDVIPSATRVVVLNPLEKGLTQEYQHVAKALGVELTYVDVSRFEQFEEAFAKITALRPDALLTRRQYLTISRRKQIANFALKERLPSMFERRDFVQAGGLLSYGFNDRAAWRRAAAYVDKILRGANPANLPIETPPVELVINLGTAKKLGITIAPELLLEADEVIK